MSAARAVFESPEMPANPASSARPVDLDHLARQTMGDTALEAEVLTMFARQVRVCLQDIAENAEGRKALAHKLKGAAAAIGAFGVAEAAGAVEAGQDDAATLARLSAAVVEAEHFILKLMRS
ncbi:Hpt domain-containing protein [Allorhizobium undicola]|uniref:Hpt domain-containing protein n=1 Tax=Allorhizobium undicola TaxID=78527 RepID=UPI000486C397|nr:Hpt domain-containing protein [Allorhizobium undicola]